MTTGESLVTFRRRVAREVLRGTAPNRRGGMRWWDLSELGLVVLAFLAYFLVRGGVVTRTAEALDRARTIVDIERAVGLFVEPTVQQWVLTSDYLWRIANFVYFWFDFPLIVVVGLWLFWRNRHEYTLLRDTLLLSGALALVFYYSFPVAPPRFLTEWGFVDTLAEFSELSYQAQSLAPFVNPFAAVPSLHVGWSLLLVVTVFRATDHPLARAGVITVFFLQVIAVVGTGNHFIFDAVVGLLVCAVVFVPVFWLHRTVYPAMRRVLAAWARGEERRRGERTREGRHARP